MIENYMNHSSNNYQPRNSNYKGKNYNPNYNPFDKKNFNPNYDPKKPNSNYKGKHYDPNYKSKKQVQPQKKVDPRKDTSVYKYTADMMKVFIDEESGQFPQKVRNVLKQMKPKLFSENGKLVADWETKWKKKPYLSDVQYELIKRVAENALDKLNKSRMINDMIEKANIYSAPFPHKHFAKKIAKVKGVIIKEIKVEANNDTSVMFRYKGNDCTAICYGQQFEDKPRYLPTKIIVNGIEKDISKININSYITTIPPKKIVVKKKN